MTRRIVLLLLLLPTLLLLPAAVWPDAARAYEPLLQYKWGGTGSYDGGTIAYKRYKYLIFKYEWERGDDLSDTSRVATVFKVVKNGVVKRTWKRSPTGNTWHTFRFQCTWRKGRYILRIRGTDVDGHSSFTYREPFLII